RRHTRFSRDWSSDVCSSDLVAVPISELPAALTAALADCAAAGFDANLVGHVGDGNFHLTLYLPQDERARAAAQQIVDRLTYRARSEERRVGKGVGGGGGRAT